MATGDGLDPGIWAAVGGLVLAIVGPLIGVIYWRQRSDISHLKLEIKKLWIEATRFHEHKAFDAERQKHWESWRAERDRWREELLVRITALESRIIEMKQENTDWRHSALQPRISQLQLDIARIKDKLELK